MNPNLQPMGSARGPRAAFGGPPDALPTTSRNDSSCDAPSQSGGAPISNRLDPSETPSLVRSSQAGDTPALRIQNGSSQSGFGGPPNPTRQRPALPGSATRESSLRVALLDGDTALHASFRSHLATHEPDWQLDLHTHGTTAWRALRATPPQLVLLERTLPDGCGLEWLRRCKRQWPDLPVVILTTQNCVKTLWAAMAAGAHGYWVKGGDDAGLVTQLRDVLVGKPAFCDQAERLLLQAFALMRQRTVNQWGLTRREEEIMTALCAHKTEKDIGMELGIETGTVHVHLMKIYKKLGMHDRASAIRNYLAAMREGGGKAALQWAQQCLNPYTILIPSGGLLDD